MKQSDVLIIGGGLAGLGCAHELTKLGIEDFLLISKDIGGRAPNAEKTIPSANFYARTEYKNLKPFLNLGRKADVMQGRLITPNKTWTPIEIMLRHPIASLRFYFLIRKFNRHYKKLMKRCLLVSQKAGIESDPFLLSLYQQPALKYLKNKNLSVIGDKLIGTLIRVTEFVKTENVNAFAMFCTWLILVNKGKECTIDFKKLIAPFKKNILLDEIISVKKEKETWIVQTKTNKFFQCKILVAALPINITQELIKVKLPEHFTINVYSAIIKGKAKPKYSSGRYNVLPANEKDIVVVNNNDGTFLFFSTQKEYNLEKYFSEFTIIKTKNWEPADSLIKVLIESKYTNNLYIIGDYHFPCLETTFITGIQAARSIKESS